MLHVHSHQWLHYLASTPGKRDKKQSQKLNKENQFFFSFLFLSANDGSNIVHRNETWEAKQVPALAVYG